jgi:hypothetical protein
MIVQDGTKARPQHRPRCGRFCWANNDAKRRKTVRIGVTVTLTRTPSADLDHPKTSVKCGNTDGIAYRCVVSSGRVSAYRLLARRIRI